MKFFKKHYLNIILVAVIAAMIFYGFRLFGDSPAVPDLVMFGLLCFLLISMQVFENGEKILAQLSGNSHPVNYGDPTVRTATHITSTKPTHRENLELALIAGVAPTIGTMPHNAEAIASNIKAMLNVLHPPVQRPDANCSGLGARSCAQAAEVQAKAHDMESARLRWAMAATNGVSKASAGPRVSKEDIEAEIAYEHYFTAEQGANHAQAINHRGHGEVTPGMGLLTFCVLILSNGTKVVGINYGAIDPAQHSAERGRQEARAQALEKVWELVGFRLRDKLTAEAGRVGIASSAAHSESM